MGGGAALATVREWMSRDPVMVPPGASVAHVAGLMRAKGIRHVLVVEGDQLVGIVSDRDVRGLTLAGEASLSPRSPVRLVMSEPPVGMSPATPLTEAARAMLDGKIGALPVLEQGRPVGILTRADGPPGSSVAPAEGAAKEETSMLNNATYDLMETAAVLSKGLHRYDTFERDARDCPECHQIWTYMRKTDEEQLRRVVAHLRAHLAKEGELEIR